MRKEADGKGKLQFFYQQSLYASLVNFIKAVRYRKKFSWATFNDENDSLGMAFKA